MEVVINYVFAWITVLLGVLLSAKYIFSKLSQCRGRYRKLFRKWNKAMYKRHVALGVVMLITGFIHGIFSSQSFFSHNLGTITWGIGLLIGISYPARKLFKSRNAWLILHRGLTLIFLFFIVLHIVDVGGIKFFSVIRNHHEKRTENINAPVYDAESALNSTFGEYNENPFGAMLKDGVYTGVADGFGKELTVEVTVSKNQVTGISVISHNEKNARFYQRPINEIPKLIVDTQTLEVDAVSGATYTSIGIINAVNDALSQAVISGELPPLDFSTRK